MVDTKTISNKKFSEILLDQTTTIYTDFCSFSTDTEEMNFSASLNLSNLKFSCALWLGSSEDETELSEDQKDFIYNFLLEAGTQEDDFNKIDKEHALTLIYS